MPDRSANNRRLAKNTLMLYGRMLFNLVLSLFTSRMILAALGEGDYGIYNVVGGVVAMFSVLTSAISSAISRFQTFELGKGNGGRLSDVFTASMCIQVSFAVIALILIESIGVWFLNTHMTIPEERMKAANWVLQFSAITFVSSITVTPYSASVVSHEDLGVFSWISIYDTVVKFIVALLLFYVVKHIDRLILYAFLLALSTLSMQMVYRIYCHKHYFECHFKRRFDKHIAKEIFSFAGWNFVGNGASLLTTQGINIVLNIAFGPIVNAARGLANTINNVISGFANNFSLALNPQIVKSYASGDVKYTIYLIERGARFSFYIFFIIALPILLETEFLMDLWLVNVPQYTVSFVRLVILVTIIDLFSTTLGAAQMATGKIRNYQLVVSALQTLYFISTAIFILRYSFFPEVVYVLSAIFSILIAMTRLLFVRKYLGISLKSYCKNVYLKMICVAVVSSVIPVVLKMHIVNDGWVVFLLISCVCVICASASCYFIGCNRNEREFVRNVVKRITANF